VIEAGPLLAVVPLAPSPELDVPADGSVEVAFSMLIIFPLCMFVCAEASVGDEGEFDVDEGDDVVDEGDDVVDEGNEGDDEGNEGDDAQPAIMAAPSAQETSDLIAWQCMMFSFWNGPQLIDFCYR
jgi:hypothetical protein